MQHRTPTGPITSSQIWHAATDLLQLNRLSLPGIPFFMGNDLPPPTLSYYESLCQYSSVVQQYKRPKFQSGRTYKNISFIIAA